MRFFTRLAGLMILGTVIVHMPSQADEQPVTERVVQDNVPLVDAPALKATRLDLDSAPELLQGATIYINEQEGVVDAGRAEFTVKQDAIILLLASWEYDGNRGGDWTEEALSREQLGETWIDLGEAPWDDKQVLFARRCQAGESFSIRTRKYNPPQPIVVPQSRLANLRDDVSPLGKALLAGLTGQPSQPSQLTPPSSSAKASLIGAPRLKRVLLDVNPLPELLQGSSIFVTEQRGDESAGRAEFTVKQDAIVLLLASWEYDGNPSGNWTSEALNREELGKTWIDLGKAPWDQNKVLFARRCKAGESFAIRTRKYHPPQPIVVPQSRFTDLQEESSPLGAALMAALKTSQDTIQAKMPQLTAQLPEGAAVLDVEGMELVPLTGENVPPYLKGAMVYQRDGSQMDGNPAAGELKFRVVREGQVFLLATWKYDGNSTGGWTQSAIPYQRLINDWALLGRCAWDSDYWLFVRDCEAGEAFELRTRKYHAPLPIVAPPVDLLSEEYADIVPVQLRERPFKKRIRQLLEAKNYAELEGLAAQCRSPDAMFPSGHSKLAAVYDTLAAVDQQDNQHYSARIAQLEAWVADDPTSLTARVGLARTLTNYAFFARGSGFSNEVTARQFEVFHEQLDKAEQVLLALGADVPKDAGYYAQRIHIATGLGASGDKVREWTLEAARLDPWNASAIYDAAVYFLPRWHGEPGDLVRLAEALVDVSRDKCGEALYARVVMGVDNLVRDRTFVEDDFSWERTRQGLKDLRRRFPESWELLNHQCRLARLAFDRELANECAEEIGNEPNLQGWGTIENYELGRKAFSPETLEGDQDRIWMAHIDGAKWACFSPDGRHVLTSGHDTLIKVWNVTSGKEVRRTAMMSRFNCIDFVDDETIVIGDGFGSIYFWKWEDDELQLMTLIPQLVVSLDCSPDGRYLHVSDYHGLTFVIDLDRQQGVHRSEQEHGYFNTGAFSADSRFLATTGADGRIIIHNLEVGRPESTFADDKTPKEVIAFSPDGTRIATGDDAGHVKVWQIDGWKLIASTVEEGDRVRGISFSPDGKQLAIARGGGLYFETGGVWILTVDERALERQIAGHTMCVYDVDFAPNGSQLMSVGVDWTLRLYDQARNADPISGSPP